MRKLRCSVNTVRKFVRLLARRCEVFHARGNGAFSTHTTPIPFSFSANDGFDSTAFLRPTDAVPSQLRQGESGVDLRQFS